MGLPAAPNSESAKPLHLRDGGGIDSTADWSSPAEACDRFHKLRWLWFRRIKSWNLVPRLWQHVSCHSEESLLSPREVDTLREDLQAYLRANGHECHTEVDEGQPLTLDLWRALLQHTEDVDQDLPQLLKEGVPTGIEEPIAASGVWRPVDPQEPTDLPLEVHDTPWSSGSKDPELLRKLIQKDLDKGFAFELQGGLEEAKRRWGSKVAAGKLGIAHAPGRDPRLFGDSTVSGANPHSRAEEKVENPGLSDVAEFVSRHSYIVWLAFSMDVSAAHKRVRVHPDEQGYSIFAVPDGNGGIRWIVYRTCHFGCSWAALWWSRVGAATVRCLHRLIWVKHGLWLYVDDYLMLFPQSVAPLLSCLSVMLMCAMGVPLSWHKLELGSQLKWIGWHFSFGARPQACLPEDKRLRLLGMLTPLCHSGTKVDRTSVSKLAGLLAWWVGGVAWLRPWLCHFFHLLNKPALRFQHLDRQQIDELLDCLDHKLLVTRKPHLSDVQAGWRLSEIGGRNIGSKQAILSSPWKNGRASCKFLDPLCQEVSCSKEESEAALLMWNAVHTQVALEMGPLAGDGTCAAADAFADEDAAGIGGWWIPSGEALRPENARWFSVQLNRSSLPDWFWTKQGKSDGLASKIAALEALGQLALLSARLEENDVQAPSTTGMVALRQWCDNQGVVCSSAKQASNKKPLCYVLQSMSLLACEYGICLRISHVKGERNVWADVLSRGRAEDPELWDRFQEANRREPDLRQLLQRPWRLPR